MDSNPENRDKTRFEHESKVILESSDIGGQRDARMYNFSNLGIYFEADFVLQPETEIQIGISNSPFAAQPDQYESFRGVVKWRKALKRSSYYYGYGVEFIRENTEDADQRLHLEARKHPRKDFAIPVKYQVGDRTYEACTESVSTGGVFIKTEDPVAVGEQVVVEIPIKKKGAVAKLTGNVVRSTRQGFGVEFLRMD
jgi:hypothetical protein